VSFVVRVALPSEYAEAGRVTAEGYHADDLLRRRDGLIDNDYEERLTDARRRAREAQLLVAVACSRSPVAKVVTNNMRHAVWPVVSDPFL
jgi:hypothetical protein